MVAATITHVIFDMDGLLLDTEKYYSIAQQNILANYGKTFDWALKAKMMGKKSMEAGEIFVRETGLQSLLTPQDFIRQRDDMLDSLFPQCELMPGVERLITHLHSCDVPMAVATSSHRCHYELKTSRHKDIFSLMSHVVVGDDPEVKQGKPAPDIFLVAASRFKESPSIMENVLVFEDAPNGVAAALNAQMHVVMVPDPNLDLNLCQGAHLILKSLMEFEPGDWGLPSFKI